MAGGYSVGIGGKPRPKPSEPKGLYEVPSNSPWGAGGNTNSGQSTSTRTPPAQATNAYNQMMGYLNQQMQSPGMSAGELEQTIGQISGAADAQRMSRDKQIQGAYSNPGYNTGAYDQQLMESRMMADQQKVGGATNVNLANEQMKRGRIDDLIKTGFAGAQGLGGLYTDYDQMAMQQQTSGDDYYRWLQEYLYKQDMDNRDYNLYKNQLRNYGV